MCAEKLKEETWNLELAKQELTISVTQLQQSLNKANAEQKRMVEHMDELTTEIEHMRDREEKLSTRIEEMKQRHEHDMATVRRHAATLQREKADHAKQLEAMSSELAIAKAQSRIGRRSHSDLGSIAGTVSDNNEEHTSNEPTLVKEKDAAPGTTSPSSPSPNPSSSTRNHALEVETLKTSLAHAHRLVSNLRSNFRKEKTEKFEFKKLLSEAQERIEQLENDPRLWTDYPSKSSSSGNGPDSGGSSRRLRKPNKRRAPVSKARMTTTTNARMHPDASDEDRLHKRHLGETSDDDFSWNTDENDDDDDDTNGNMGHSSAAAAAGATAAGFTSLETELAKSQQQQQTTTPKVVLEPPSPSTNDNDGLRSLGDELDAANISKDVKIEVKVISSSI